MKILVNDTNIFIDMQALGLLRKMCKLPYRIHTVDFVINEIVTPDCITEIKRLVELGLIEVRTFTAPEVATIAIEHSQITTGNLSFPDVAVCRHAIENDCSLITGDKQLRKYAEEQNVEVHGVLFIFDEMVAHAIIPPSDGALMLQRLMSINARLPRKEIETRILTWEKEFKE